MTWLYTCEYTTLYLSTCSLLCILEVMLSKSCDFSPTNILNPYHFFYIIKLITPSYQTTQHIDQQIHQTDSMCPYVGHWKEFSNKLTPYCATRLERSTFTHVVWDLSRYSTDTNAICSLLTPAWHGRPLTASKCSTPSSYAHNSD